MTGKDHVKTQIAESNFLHRVACRVVAMAPLCVSSQVIHRCDSCTFMDTHHLCLSGFGEFNIKADLALEFYNRNVAYRQEDLPSCFK